MNQPRLAALALAALFATPLAALAQNVPVATGATVGAPVAGARHHHGNRYMHALRAVNLTPAQKAQIKTFAQASKAANQNADPATRKANRDHLRAQIDGVLTPDQRAQLQAELAKPAPAAK